MPDVFLIADDLTGAADSAAPFASHGIPARLVFEWTSEPAPGVTALSTNSRDLDLQPAQSAILKACRQVRSSANPEALLFKKIDSTLRGHLVDELKVLIDQFQIDRLLLTPAFPAQGRTTIGARQHVHGIPLSQTSFAGDRSCDDLAQLFDGLSGLPIRTYQLGSVRGDPELLAGALSRPGIHIPDIKTDDDMRCCVNAALEAETKRFCGAGGLGRTLAHQLAPDRGAPVRQARLTGPVLIVAGSRNRATLEQVETVRQSGTRVVSLRVERDSWERTAVAELRAGSSLVVSSMSGSPSLSDPEVIRQRLGRGIQEIVARVPPGLLVLTGGDIAASVCRALEVRAIALRGEVEPGVPQGELEGGDVSGLPVVTKAGGFGDPGTFRRLLQSVGRE